MKKTALSLIAVLAVTASVSLQGKELESRSASWDAGQKKFAKGIKSYAGRIKDGTYINGMWSGATLQYAISDPKTEESPTNFSDVKIFPMAYFLKKWGKPGFFFNSGSKWAAPAMRKTQVQHFTNWMGHNRWGGAVVFNNVFGKNIQLTLDGAYGVTQNESWKACWVDSWILKVNSENKVKVLFENHRPVSWHKAGSKFTEVELDDPIEVALKPGERILVVMSGRKTKPSGIFYRLDDSDLKWDVTIK